MTETDDLSTVPHHLENTLTSLLVAQGEFQRAFGLRQYDEAAKYSKAVGQCCEEIRRLLGTRPLRDSQGERRLGAVVALQAHGGLDYEAALAATNELFPVEVKPGIFDVSGHPPTGHCQCGEPLPCRVCTTKKED